MVLRNEKILLLLFFSLGSYASVIFDPLIGTRIGQVITNKILASPPMPKIAGKEASFQISPLGSVVEVKAEKSEPDSENFTGSSKGYSAGMGFTYNSKTKLSFYGFATSAETKGEIQTPGFNPNSGTKVSGMKNSGTNVSLGASYRLWSENDFPLVVGILAGPFVSKYKNSLVATSKEPGNSSGPMTDHPYSSESTVYGPMAGIQAHYKLAGVSINPYFLYYKDISNFCETYSTDADTTGRFWESAKTCNPDNREVYVDGTFSAYGLILGYGGLSLGVLAEPEKNDELSSLTVQSYTLSYTFGF